MTVRLRRMTRGRIRRPLARVLSLLLAAALVLPSVPPRAASADGQETIAKWSFAEAVLPAPPSEGTPANRQHGEFSVHKAIGTEISYTASNKSLWTNNWSVGDYWQAGFSTEGYAQLEIAWQQWGSNTGPRDFRLQYSLDGVHFVDLPAAEGTAIYAIGAAASTAYRRNLPGELDNRPAVYIRWTVASDAGINGGTITSGGTSRMSEIEVRGIPLPADDGRTPMPDAGRITLTDDEVLTGQAGAVTGGAHVFVYPADPATVTDAVYGWYEQAGMDGSFGPIQLALGGGSDVWVTARESGKTESPAVKISILQTAPPDAGRVALASGRVTGEAGAVPAGSAVTAYDEAGSVVGTAIAGADGSFVIALTVPDGLARVYIAAKETGKRESARVLVQARVRYQPGDIVISQFYPNAGNSGAFYNTKFVELYNNTDQDIHFNGEWTLQYGSATGSALGTNANTRVVLNGTIPARGYFLVTGNTGSNGANLPVAADQTSTLNPSGSTGGILALAHTTDPITSQDDPALIDVVAYGNGSNTNFTFRTDQWGTPFYVANVSSGTILRKTDTGSDPRGVIGAGNGWYTRNPSEDFVMHIPLSAGDPKEIVIRNSKSMAVPDASRITVTETGGTLTVTGSAGAVPADAFVRVYLADGPDIMPGLTVAGTARADADGAFTLSFANGSGALSVFVTHAASEAAPESAYARVDLAADPSAVRGIQSLRAVDAGGLPLHIGYRTAIEGVATTANRALGVEPTSFHLQDGTGGIHVVAGKDPSALGASVPVEAGRTYRVTGYPIFAAGTLRFVAESIDYTGSGNLPDPVVLSPADLSDMAKAEPEEGKLVTVQGKLTNVPALGPDYDLTIADEDGHTAMVRVLGTTGIDVSRYGVGDSFRFTGILAQSKRTGPYNSGYVVLPRTSADIKGEVQLEHEPPDKAYIGFDVLVQARARYADEVILHYKAESDAGYRSIPMLTADGLNYAAAIPKADVPPGKLLYYIEASTADGRRIGAGSAERPFEIPVVEDTDGPDFFNEVPRNGSETETAHPVISVEMADPSGVNTASVRIAVDGRDFTGKADISETRVELVLTPDDDLAVGEHTVAISAEDNLGNAATFGWKFRIAERFTGGNHYYGTTHNHTGISHDAAGTPEEALKAARFHGYDWFAFSDHSHDIDPELRGGDTVNRGGMPERSGGAEWRLTRQLSDLYTKDGEFVVFPSFEMTSTTWGHSNVFGTDRFVDRIQDGGIYQDLNRFYAWVLTYDDIAAQFNHPTWGGSKPFNGFLPYNRKLDELFTMFEVGNGSGQYTYVNAEDLYFRTLDLGWHLAPTFGEDNHDATWGQTKKRTVIVAKELTRDALLDAMRKMRVYMTEDPNFRLDVLASGWYMGSTTDTKTLKFDIRGEDPVWEEKSDPQYFYLDEPTNDYIERVDLITNGGVVIDTFRPSGNVTRFSWNPEFTVIGGQQWFVVRITQKDGDRIYSAPIWSPVEPLSVRVTNVDVAEGGLVGGVPATLEVGIANTGLTDVPDIAVEFYYDQIDDRHRIGSVRLAMLKVNESATVSVVWGSPVPGDRKIIVRLSSAGMDLGDNRFELMFRVKEPLGRTILIDASRNNENTTTDTGTYRDNLKRFTAQMRQAGFAVEENRQPLTSALLENVDILYLSLPASAYDAGEIEAIAAFVAKGGGLFIAGKGIYRNTGTDLLNDVLDGVGSAIRVNKDELYDETAEGNFWSNPLNQRWAVRLHPRPAKDHVLNDFVSTIEFYSGASLAAEDAAGGLAGLREGGNVRVLAWGNESTFQNAGTIDAQAYRYNVHAASTGSGPARDDITGGSAIPVIAAETIGQGRIVVAGMNVFNDLQLDESYNEKGNDEFALNVMRWLAHLEPKVMPIGEARKQPTGTDVVVQGSVTTAAGVFFDAFFLQDDTGGIMAFNEVPEGALDLGDIVRVYGSIDVFENSLEVRFGAFDRSVVRIGGGPPVEPMEVSTGDAAAEAHQGRLVKVTGTVTEIRGEWMFTIDDGSGPVLIFVDGYIANRFGPVPKPDVGDTLEAVGLSDRFSGGDRIRVRDTRELKVVGKRVPVTGIRVEPAELELAEGQSAKLTVTVLPDNATDKRVRWNSGDERVAKVEDGVVTAVSPGRTAIIAETVDGGFRAAVRVTVRRASGDEPGGDQPGEEPGGSPPDDEPGGHPPDDDEPGDDRPGEEPGGSPPDDEPGGHPPDDDEPGDDRPGEEPGGSPPDDEPGDHPPGDDEPGGDRPGEEPGGSPPDDEPGGHPPGGGSPGGGSDDASGDADDGTGVVDASPDLMEEGEDGRAYLHVPEGATAVRFPAGFAERLTRNGLTVVTAAAELTLPAQALKDWFAASGGEDGRQTAAVTLHFAPLSEEDAAALIGAAERRSDHRIRLSSGVFDIAVTITADDGGESGLTEFGVPLELRLPANPDADPELAAIFRLNDDGTWEYVGGRDEDGSIRVVLTRPGKYAVLEMTRPFEDLERDHWAYVAVQHLIARGLIGDASGSRFEPDRPVTRAEFALLLMLALNLEGPDGELRFPDADQLDDRLKLALARAVQAGIIRGDGTGRLRPNDPVTRAEMAVMTARALRLAVNDAESGFADDGQIPEWAKGSVRALRENGIIRGRGDGRFLPFAPAGRAEAAMIIFNVLRRG